jgi:hypothetical protein
MSRYLEDWLTRYSTNPEPMAARAEKMAGRR